jgi:hypothetical protein
MTTHIFLALGMWDEVVAQNEIALGLTARLPGHYSSWLFYGLLQQGRYYAAEELLLELRTNLGARGTPAQHAALAAMRANYLLHSEDRSGRIAAWELDRDLMPPSGVLLELFSEGLLAFGRRDAAALSRLAGSMAAQAEAVGRSAGARNPDALAARVLAREIGAMQLFLSGGDSRQAAVRALREATAMEDAIPMEFGPPPIVEPSHELLAGFLMELEPGQAVDHYRRALLLAPGRSRSLLGLVRAAIATGDRATAEAALDSLDANWRQADPRVRDGLVPIRRIVSRMPKN